jgi:hypothetical protein
MTKEQERKNFDYFDRHCPEPKLELVNGRLIAGNSLDGSKLLLDHILRGWSVDAAVALGSIDLWAAALREYEAGHKDFAAPDVTAGAEGHGAEHRGVRNHLYFSLSEAAEALGGEALGRDIVMRLGDDGFTPDIMFFKSEKLNTLYEYYLAGPAELVIEVVLPAHRDYDYRVKREYYARGGVPEYVIVDPEQRHFEFLRLTGSNYAVQQPDAGGCYRPESVPGLAIVTKHMCGEGERFSVRRGPNPFVVEQSQPEAKRRKIEDGLGWDELPFDPRLDLRPVPLRFEEYVCWSPESKFEFSDGRIQLSGDEGVRNVTAMLLATLGLREVCRFASPAQWFAAIERRRGMESRNDEIRQQWRARAASAAELLRAKYQAQRVAITGDLLSPQPLGFWSRLTLAAWSLKPEDEMRVYQDLSPLDVDFFGGGDKYFQERLDKDIFKLEDI